MAEVLAGPVVVVCMSTLCSAGFSVSDGTQGLLFPFSVMECRTSESNRRTGSRLQREGSKEKGKIPSNRFRHCGRSVESAFVPERPSVQFSSGGGQQQVRRHPFAGGQLGVDLLVGVRVGAYGADPPIGKSPNLAAAQGAHRAFRAKVQDPGIELVDVVVPAVPGEESVETVRCLLVPAGRPDRGVAAVAHLDVIAPAVRPIKLLVDSTSHHKTSSS